MSSGMLTWLAVLGAFMSVSQAQDLSCWVGRSSVPSVGYDEEPQLVEGFGLCGVTQFLVNSPLLGTPLLATAQWGQNATAVGAPTCEQAVAVVYTAAVQLAQSTGSTATLSNSYCCTTSGCNNPANPVISSPPPPPPSPFISPDTPAVSPSPSPPPPDEPPPSPSPSPPEMPAPSPSPSSTAPSPASDRPPSPSSTAPSPASDRPRVPVIVVSPTGRRHSPPRKSKSPPCHSKRNHHGRRML